MYLKLIDYGILNVNLNMHECLEIDLYDVFYNSQTDYLREPKATF